MWILEQWLCGITVKHLWFKHPRIHSQLGLFPWRKKMSKLSKNVTQCLASGINHLILIALSISSLCLISHQIFCHVWDPLEMKSGISDLPNPPQELWEWFLSLITTLDSRPNEGWALKETNVDLSCSYRGFNCVCVFADRSKLRLSR